MKLAKRLANDITLLKTSPQSPVLSFNRICCISRDNWSFCIIKSSHTQKYAILGEHCHPINEKQILDDDVDEQDNNTLGGIGIFFKSSEQMGHQFQQLAGLLVDVQIPPGYISTT